MDKKIGHLIRQWTRLGVTFAARPASRTPDLERLILDTARHAHANARLWIMAITWLCRYSDCTAKHRLKALALDELEARHLPTFGLMLETIREKSGTRRFDSLIEWCPAAAEPDHLFDIARITPTTAKLSREKASKTSIRWGRWAEDFDLKNDALKSARWIIENNPSFRYRMIYKGNLRASILAELENNPGSGRSESELSRACGSSRPAIVAALRDLEQAGFIRQKSEGNRRATLLTAAA